MEDNKYYAPEAEEIHLGFEFEARYKKEPWVKMVADDDFFDTDFDTAPVIRFGAVGNKHSDVEFRVKYLDKEDIEAEGFTQIPKYYPATMLKISGGRSILMSFPDDGRIVIYPEKAAGGDFMPLFDGKIRNRSELKKILKMIGV
jgi:hypothetical protein